MTKQLQLPALDELRLRRSAKWRTYPADVLPMFVAEMDVALAAPIADALMTAISRSDTGYAARSQELPDAFAGFAARRWGWTIDAEQITVATDISVAMVETLRALRARDTTVAVSPPIYPPFYGWLREVGARSLEVPLQHGTRGWRLDLPALEAAFRQDVDIYLLCNPHNPVGTVHTQSELNELAALASRYDVTIISDEIHAPLVLPDADFVPFLDVSDESRRCGIALESASKGWNLAGLKAAMIVTADDRMRKVHGRLPEELPWRAGHLGVLASIEAYRHGEPWLDEVVELLDHNRRLLSELLGEFLPFVGYELPDASYLAWLDFRALPVAHEVQPGLLVDAVREQCGVALSSGTAFGSNGTGHLRLNYATHPSVLRDAVERLSTCG